MEPWESPKSGVPPRAWRPRRWPWLGLVVVGAPPRSPVVDSMRGRRCPGSSCYRLSAVGVVAMSFTCRPPRRGAESVGFLMYGRQSESLLATLAQAASLAFSFSPIRPPLVFRHQARSGKGRVEGGVPHRAGVGFPPRLRCTLFVV